MMKRKISGILVLGMFFSLFDTGYISANTQYIETENAFRAQDSGYVPADSLILRYPHLNSAFGIDTTSAAITKTTVQTENFDGVTNQKRLKLSYDPQNASQNGAAIEGVSFQNNKRSASNPNFDMKNMAAGEKYVISFYAKTAQENAYADINAGIKFGDGIVFADGLSQGITVSDEWVNFCGSLTVPGDFNADDIVAENTLYVGFSYPETNIPETDIVLSDMYIAKADAVDMRINCSGSLKILKTEENSNIAFDAMFFDQTGEAFSVNKNISWFLLNEDKEETNEAYSVSKNGMRAVFDISQIPAGIYYAAAVYEEKNITRLCRFEIIPADAYSDHVPGAMNPNLIPDASALGGKKYIGCSSGVSNHDYITYSALSGDETGEAAAVCLSYDGGEYKSYFEDTLGSPGLIWTRTLPDGTKKYDNWKIFAGIETNRESADGQKYSNYFGFAPERGKTYAIKARLKNVSSGGKDAYFGIAMNRADGNNNFYPVYTGTYGSTGMKLSGEEWEVFSDTITIPSDWPVDVASAVAENSVYGPYYSALFMGMPANPGNIVGAGSAFYIDVSEPDSFYIAEEQVYDIENKADKAILSKGETFNAEAAVINQTGARGTLLQDIEWTITDINRQHEAEGFEISPSAGGTSASISIRNDADYGTYVLIARSKDYGICKGFYFCVVNDKTFTEHTGNLIPQKYYFDASENGGRRYMGTKPHPYLSQNTVQGEKEDGAGIEYIYDGAGYSGELSQTRPLLSMHIPEIPYYERWKVFGGFETNRYSAQNGPTPSYFGFEPEIGKTYVISARIKNSSKNGQKLFFGAAMNYTYGADTAVTTNEYGKDGMEIGNEWTDFNATITIPEGYRTYYDDSGNTEYYNGLYFGMAEGSEYGTAFTIDASRPDSFYFDEEVLYDVVLSANKDTVLINDNSIDIEAKVVDQIGLSGNYLQNFDWYVLNSDKTAVEGKIKITPQGSSDKVRLSWNGDLPYGVYTAAAVSKDYDGFIKTIKIAYLPSDPDNEAPDMPDNLIPDASENGGWKYLNSRNMESIQSDPAVSSEKAAELGVRSALRWHYEGEGAFSSGNGHRGFYGFVLPGPVMVKDEATGNWVSTNEELFGFDASAGKSYVLSARLMDDSSGGGLSRFGIAMNDSYNVNNIVSGSRYGIKGMEIGKSWTDFKDVITLPSDYNSSNTTAARRLNAGFAEGVFEGSALYIDTSDKDSVYFAEEIPYRIEITSDSDGGIRIGEPITLNAEVLDQIGIKGNLCQDIIWLARYDGEQDAANGVLITSGKGFAGITADERAAGKSIIVTAISPEYGISGSLVIEKPVYDKKLIYVSPNGDDLASGDKDTPLRTPEGAISKVRMLKARGYTGPVDVIFEEGEYRISSSLNFSSSDSGTEDSPVIYKGAPGARVVFSGASPIDLSTAKKVSNEAILSRLREDVREKVIEIDLTENGFPYSLADESMQPTTATVLSGGYEYPQLYLDSEEQRLSEWPNGDANYVNFDYAVENDKAKNDTIVYKEEEPSAWENASDWWVGGYMGYDYDYLRLPGVSVDKQNKQIKLDVIDTDSSLIQVIRPSDRGYGTPVTKRWKAFNLLEEIDVPTEWYIDRSSMMLYYYPPEGYSDKELEISVLKTPIVMLNDARYISFENIRFEKTRQNGITVRNSENITVKNCEFFDIGVNGYKTEGTTYAQSDMNYWQRQLINAAYNCEVSDCVFFNTGGNAIWIEGGNVDTLTPANNIVKNNIIMKAAQKSKYQDAVFVRGCGTKVINNNISRSSFQGLRHYGNDHDISYNEIYNVKQEADDAGAIYCGRNTIQRGSVISYNYLHDLNSVDPLVFNHQVGIYWDDGQVGMNAHHNIIRNVFVNFYTSGVDNHFHYNTSIDIGKNLYVADGGAASNNNTETKTWSGNIADPELYYAAYPSLKQVIESDDVRARSLARLNTVGNNFCVNASISSDAIGEYAKYPDPVYKTIFGYTYKISDGEPNAGIKDNIYLASFNDFVDPENQDYRVKKSAGYSYLGILDEDFDIETIGVISDKTLDHENISLISPYNNENTDKDTVHFMWDEAYGATNYRIIVAADMDFNNIAAEKICYYNYADIELPNNGEKYFWKVIAYNTSREFASEWESDIYSFTNGEKISVIYGVDGNEFAADIVNHYYQNGIACDIYTAYYKNGRFLSVQKTEENLSYEETVCINSGINEEYDEIRMMIWDKEQRPLRNVIKVTKGGQQ